MTKFKSTKSGSSLTDPRSAACPVGHGLPDHDKALLTLRVIRSGCGMITLDPGLPNWEFQTHRVRSLPSNTVYPSAEKRASLCLFTKWMIRSGCGMITPDPDLPNWEFRMRLGSGVAASHVDHGLPERVSLFLLHEGDDKIGMRNDNSVSKSLSVGVPDPTWIRVSSLLHRPWGKARVSLPLHEGNDKVRMRNDNSGSESP
jgi:hypothetical protein